MKKLNKKGFTLIEMLVVIAIIAILVAIIIPTVSSATTKAKAATDAANLRSAKAVVTIGVLDGTYKAGDDIDADACGVPATSKLDGGEFAVEITDEAAGDAENTSGVEIKVYYGSEDHDITYYADIAAGDAEPDAKTE